MANQEVLQYEQVIDFGGGGAPVDVTMSDPPGGPYEVEILASKEVMNERTGKKSIHVNVAIVEPGPGQGISTLVFMGTDYTKNFNVGHMFNLLNGAGVPADKLKGKIAVKPELIKGRHAFIFVREPMEGELNEESGKPARASKNFITKAQYEQAKRAQSVAGAAPQQARTAPAAAPQNGALAGSAQQAAPVITQPAAAPAAAVDLAGMFGPQ